MSHTDLHSCCAPALRNLEIAVIAALVVAGISKKSRASTGAMSVIHVGFRYMHIYE